jgi:uncharacterized SAM-binding protein YcdF (DUF218 family)
MVPIVLKELFVPGSYLFFLIALIPGTLLLYRGKDGGRAGRLWVTALVLLYWILSTPAAALGLLRLLSPDDPPVQARDQARGATAIVVLGAGLDTYRSRGDSYDVPTGDDALRIIETLRVYRVIDPRWIVVTGGLGSERHTEAQQMAEELKAMGIPGDRIVEESQSTNTRDHARYVPPLLEERHVPQFVLVTSRQHMARALRVFRKAGLDPVPSSPEVYETNRGPWEYWLPSGAALHASNLMIYDELAMAYYWLRGWI